MPKLAHNVARFFSVVFRLRPRRASSNASSDRSYMIPRTVMPVMAVVPPAPTFHEPTLHAGAYWTAPVPETRPRRKPVPALTESLPPPALLGRRAPPPSSYTNAMPPSSYAPPTPRTRSKSWWRMSSVSNASTTIDFASYNAANASPMPSFTPLMRPRQEFVHQPEDFRDLREEMRRGPTSQPAGPPPPAEMRSVRPVMNRPAENELSRQWRRPRAHGPSAW